jgi:transposase
MVNLEERIALIRLYYANGNSAKAALRQFRVENPHVRNLCQTRTVVKLIRKFETTGSVKDLPWSGRPKTSDDVVLDVVLSSTDISNQSYYQNSSTRAISANLDYHEIF